MAIGVASASSSRFFADRPIGASIVLRIEDPVAAIFAKELADVLAVGIEDDGDFVACGDLINDLPDERRFAAAGVAGDLNVMGFAVAFDDQILAGFARLQPLEEVAAIREPEAQTVAFGQPIEAPAADQTGSSQQPTFSSFRVVFPVEIVLRRRRAKQSRSRSR